MCSWICRDYSVAVVNTTTTAQPGMTVTANVYSLDNKPLCSIEEKKDVAANAVTTGFKLDLAPLMGTGVVLVKLELRNAGGAGGIGQFVLAGERRARQYRQLNHLPASTLAASATCDAQGRDECHAGAVAEHGSRGGAGEQADSCERR